MFTVTVKDRYCGAKDRHEESVDVITKEEAQAWSKQFRAEYPKEDGYSVKITTN